MRRRTWLVVMWLAVAACGGAEADAGIPNAAASTDASTTSTAAPVTTLPPTTVAATVVTTTVPLATTTPTTSSTTSTTTTTTAAPTTTTTTTTTTTAAPTTTSTAAPTTTSTTTTTAAPTTTTSPPTASGRSIFVANCVICHGENGEGGYGANLQLSSLTRAQIVTTVTFGRGAMEPFEEILTPAEIDAVAGYVKRLQQG